MLYLKGYKLFESLRELTLYHGSPEFFYNFKEQATFFSETEKFAREYAETKSMDYGMDKEAKVYKVKVKCNIFDINEKGNLEKLKKELPNEIEYVYNNFGFSALVPKEEFMMNLQGKDIIEPYDKAINSKVGDNIPDPTYPSGAGLLVVKEDKDNVYCIEVTTYKRYKEDLLKDKFNIYGRAWLKDIVTKLEDKIKSVYLEDLGQKWISDRDKKAAIYQSQNGAKYTELSEDSINKIGEYYNEAIKELDDYLYDNYNFKEFNKKTKIVDLSDSWRFYENKTVTEAIIKLGYGGYVAKESNVPTYLIFNPNKDVNIIEYDLPYGIFYSEEEIKGFKQYQKYVYDFVTKEGLLDGAWTTSFYMEDMIKSYRDNTPKEDFIEQLLNDKDKYFYKYKK